MEMYGVLLTWGVIFLRLNNAKPPIGIYGKYLTSASHFSAPEFLTSDHVFNIAVDMIHIYLISLWISNDK